MRMIVLSLYVYFFFFQAEDGIRDRDVTGVQTCALPISSPTSPEMASDDSASVRTPGRKSAKRVSHPGWKWSCVDTPPMKLDDGSNPSGGRLNELCSFWNRPVKLTCPTVPRS